MSARGHGSGRGRLLLLGGPAGAGKSTLAAAWCAARVRAVRVDLDQVREMIVSGRADPQVPNTKQSRQYALSVHACCARARVWLEAGYDVAIDDVLEPAAFEHYWRPWLDGLFWQLVIVLPTLEETLSRSAQREKRVLPEHTRAQHRSSLEWPAANRIDTTGLSVEQRLRLLQQHLQD